MKYLNANEVLPKDLISLIQKYYQGGCLYIPKENYRRAKRRTDYKIELEKRNKHIYLRHLEGKANEELGSIYHLAESSIRRILLKERAEHQKMEGIIKEILKSWGIENGQLLQVYSSAWETDHSYIIKVYDNKEQLERNIKTTTILLNHNIPVAEILPTLTGEKFVFYQNKYFLVSKKLRGSNLSDLKDEKTAWNMGYAIAQLHKAFTECEKEIAFWDNSLLKEMKGWVQESLKKNEWQTVDKEQYLKAVRLLEETYDSLPKQLIHRDVHFGNFLFHEGELSGYIDFDLSQRNIRIFDICYFLTGLLAEETKEPLTKAEWMKNVKAVIAGYESISMLSKKEKEAVPYVMECIEIFFAAYFLEIQDTKCANDANKIFQFVQGCQKEIQDAIKS